jgi:KaiC/GvpD/RAD55 family RecA-like ATPase
MNGLPKVPTGIPGLDALLDGGLTPGAFVILDGDPMSAVHVLALEYAAKGIAAGDGCVYLSTKEFGETLAQELVGAGALDAGKRLSIVDAYSALADPQIRDTEMIQYVSSVSDLPKLSHLTVTAMSNLFSSGVIQQRAVVESVDTMMMYLPIQAIYRFLFFIKAKVRSFKGTSIAVLSTDLCQEKDRGILMELADVVIRMESASSTIKVTMPSRPPATGRYSVDDNGLKISPNGPVRR